MTAMKSLLLCVTTLLATSLPATTIDWTGATDTAWTTPGNWVGGLAPANSLTLDIARLNRATYANQPSVGTTSVAGLIAGSSSGSATINGTSLAIGGSGIVVESGANALTLAAPVTIGASQVWTNNTRGTVTLGGAVAVTSPLALAKGNFAFNAAGSGSSPVTIDRASVVAASNTALGTGTVTVGNTAAIHVFTGSLVGTPVAGSLQLTSSPADMRNVVVNSGGTLYGGYGMATAGSKAPTGLINGILSIDYYNLTTPTGFGTIRLGDGAWLRGGGANQWYTSTDGYQLNGAVYVTNLQNTQGLYGVIGGTGKIVLANTTAEVSIGSNHTFASSSPSAPAVEVRSNGYLTFTGSNAFTGTANAYTGTLRLRDAGQFYNATSSGASAVNVRNGAYFYLDDTNNLLATDTGSGTTQGRVATSTQINLFSATLNHKGKSNANTSEILGTVSLNGASAISADIDAGGTAPYYADITIGNLQRNPGSYVFLSSSALNGAVDSDLGNLLGTNKTGRIFVSQINGQAFVASPGPGQAGLTNGILGGWARVPTLAGTQEWATYDFATNGVRALQTYEQTIANGAVTDISPLASDNVKWLANNQTWTLATADHVMNSLNVQATTGTNTLQLAGFHANLTSGGLLNYGQLLTINDSGATGGLTAGGTASTAELFVQAPSAVTIGARIVDNPGADATYGTGDDGSVSLVKISGGVLTLSNTGNSFTGAVYMNAGTLTANGFGTLGQTAKAITLAGGTLSANDNTSRTWATSLDVPSSATLSVDRVASGTNNLASFGNLAVADGVNLTINSGNGYAAGFTSSTFAGGSILALNNATVAANPHALGSVSLNGEVLVTVASGVYASAGALSGSGKLLRNGSGGTLSLVAPSPTYATGIDVFNGTVNVAADGALGTGTTTLWANTDQLLADKSGAAIGTRSPYLNFTAGQSTFPKLNVLAYAALNGTLTGMSAKVTSGDVVLAPGAIVIEGATSDLTIAQNASLYLGVTSVGAANAYTVSDASTAATAYKGVAFNTGTAQYTAGSTMSGDLTAVTGDLEAYLLTGQTWQAASGHTPLLNSASTIANVRGPAAMTLRASGSSDAVAGTVTTINRAGDLGLQNTTLLTFDKAAAGDAGKALPVGVTANINDGIVGLTANGGSGIAGTVNINSGATLYLNQTPTGGTFHLNHGSALYMNSAARLNSGGVFTYADGTLIEVAGAIADSTISALPRNADYIANGIAIGTGGTINALGTGGLVLGQGRRLTTTRDDDLSLNLGGGITADAGVTSVIISGTYDSAANTVKKVTVNDFVSLSGVDLQLGDTGSFTTLKGTADMRRYAVTGQGTVDIKAGLSARNVDVRGGSVYLSDAAGSVTTLSGALHKYAGSGNLYLGNGTTGTVGIAGDLVLDAGYTKVQQAAKLADGTLAAKIDLNGTAALAVTQQGTAGTWQAIAVPIVVSTTGVDSATNYNLGWMPGGGTNPQQADFTNVQLSAGSTLVVNADDYLANRPVRFSSVQLNGTAGVSSSATLTVPGNTDSNRGNFIIGNVSNQTPGTARMLNVTATRQWSSMGFVGSLAPDVTVVYTAGGTSDATPLASTFMLNGGKFEAKGMAINIAQDYGTGTFLANSVGDTGYNVTMGRDGTGAPLAGTTFDLAYGGMVTGYVREYDADSGGTALATPITNQIGSRVDVRHLGTGSSIDATLRFGLYGSNQAGVFRSTAYFSNVHLYDSAYLKIATTANDEILAKASFVLEGTGSKIDGSYDGNNIIGDITATGASSVRTVTVNGPSYNKMFFVGLLDPKVKLQLNVGAANAHLNTGFSLSGGEAAIIGQIANVNDNPGSGTLRATGGTLNLNGINTNNWLATSMPGWTGSTGLNLVVENTVGTQVNVNESGTLGNLRMNASAADRLSIATGKVATVSGDLSGTGYINLARIALASGASLSPGSDNVGTLTATSAFTAPDAFKYNWDYAGNGAASNDKFAVTGGFEMTNPTVGPTLVVSNKASTDPAGQTFVLATWTGADPTNTPSWIVDTSATVSTGIVWDGAAGDHAWDNTGASGNWGHPSLTGGTVTYNTTANQLELSALSQAALIKPVTIGAGTAVRIAPTTGSHAIAGPVGAATIASLIVGGGGADSAGLDVSGGTLTVAGLTDVQANGSITVNNTLTTNSLALAGTLTVPTGKTANVQTATSLSTNGLLDVTGTLVVPSLAIPAGTAQFHTGTASVVPSVTVSGAGTLTATAGTFTSLAISGGTATLSGTASAPTLSVTGGTVGLGGSRAGNATVGGGSVGTGGSVFAVSTKLVIRPAAGDVTLTYGGGVGGSGSFGVKGADLRNVLDTIVLSGNKVTLAQNAGTAIAGLAGGFVDGAANSTGYPATTVQELGLASAQVASGNSAGAGWLDNKTLVYTGQMYLGSTSVNFVENFDDYALVKVKVNGAWQTLINNNSWNDITTNNGVVANPGVVSANGVLTVPSTGWYDVEFRFGQGIGGVGANQGPWSTAPIIAFGYDSQGRATTTKANYVAPTDSGAMDVFRVGTMVAAAANLPSTGISVTSSTELALPSLGAATLGALSLVGSDLTLSGAPGVSFAGAVSASGTSSVVFGAGTTQLVLADNHVDVLGAGDSLTLPAVTFSGGSIIANPTGAGTVVLGGATAISGTNPVLDIRGGTLRLGTAATFGGSRTLVLKGVTLAGMADAWTSSLDIQDHCLVVDYSGGVSPADAIRNQVASGFSAGQDWSGMGIRTTSAIPSGIQMVGYAEASDILGLGPTDTGEWSGGGDVVVNGTSILVKFTYAGDADLNGSVDLDDLFRLIDGFNASREGNPVSWSSGDMDYNGTVDLDDLFLLIDGFNASSASGPLSTQAVPEPGLAGLVLVALLGGRRRRSRIGRQAPRPS